MSKRWRLLLTATILITAVIWFSVFSTSKKLKVVTCNVGQGDATLVVYKSFEILIDGGPDNNILDCLSKHMPFWDRTLEMIILTHPQSDHYTGLIAVLERFKVKNILANSLDSGSQAYSLLKNQVLARGVKVVNPVGGMVIRFELIQLDILHPSTDFLEENLQAHRVAQDNLSSSVLPQESSSFQRALTFKGSGVLGASDSKLDPNEFSIVFLLSFGSFKYLFTGDAGSEILDSLASGSLLTGEKPINYIKIPHHGSKTAISEKLYDLVKFGIAVISVGKNSYGHPNEEVIRALSDQAIKVLRTDKDGDIIVESDGKRMWVKGGKY